MEISNELLQEIERIAACAYEPRQTAYMLGMKPVEFEELIKDENSAAAIAYFKGYYSSELSVRESIMTLARNGSSPAQTTANNLFNELRTNLRKAGFNTSCED